MNPAQKRNIGVIVFALFCFVITFRSCDVKAQDSPKVYQYGVYKTQLQKPTDINIYARLSFKYVRNGFNWFVLVMGNETFVVSIIDEEVYKNNKVGDMVLLLDVIRISSNKWKRK